MPRPHAFAVAALFLGVLAGCGALARETSERASPIDVRPRVTTTIDVGPKGQMSSLLFAEGAVWVTAWRGSSSTVSTVLRIDPSTNRIEARIPVEGVPGWEVGGGGMATGAGAVWIAGATSGEAVLERIDPTTSEVVLAAEGGLWFVGSESRSGGVPTTIDRFNPSTGRVDISFDPPGDPIALAATPGSIWVLNYEGSLTRIDFRPSRSVEDVTPPSNWSTYRSAKWGYTVSFPTSWQRVERPVTSLADPREILSLGTFPLRHRPTNCDAFAGSARDDLGPADAFLTVQERGFDHNSEWPDFPPRPARFGPAPENASVAEPACGDRPDTDVRWFNLTDAGRHFHVLVVFGPDAPPGVRRDAWRILNTLRLDPNVKPNWPASP